MATIYRGSPSRFAFAQSHYASSSAGVASSAMTNEQLQMQFRYSAYANGENGPTAPLPSAPLPPRPNGLVSMNGNNVPLPAVSAGKQMYGNAKAPMYVQGLSGSPLYVNPLVPKAYPPQPSEMLFVSPGLPTPVELSIYEMKQPTGLLHVTIGNQTVEFLDGVANMPQKR